MKDLSGFSEESAVGGLLQAEHERPGGLTQRRLSDQERTIDRHLVI